MMLNTSNWGREQTGRVWYDTQSKTIKYWDGARVKSIIRTCLNCNKKLDAIGSNYCSTKCAVAGEL